MVAGVNVWITPPHGSSGVHTAGSSLRYEPTGMVIGDEWGATQHRCLAREAQEPRSR